MTAKIPEQDAVTKLKELFDKRKSELHPSPEMDEVVKKEEPKEDL